MIISLIVSPFNSIVIAMENSFFEKGFEHKKIVEESDKNFLEDSHGNGEISDDRLEKEKQDNSEDGIYETSADFPISAKATGENTEINHAVVINSFTKDTKYFQVTQPNVTIYDNSTGKLVPVGKLTEGAIYPLNRVLGDWIEIQFSDRRRPA